MKPPHRVASVYSRRLTLSALLAALMTLPALTLRAQVEIQGTVPEAVSMSGNFSALNPENSAQTSVSTLSEFFESTEGKSLLKKDPSLFLVAPTFVAQLNPKFELHKSIISTMNSFAPGFEEAFNSALKNPGAQTIKSLGVQFKRAYQGYTVIELNKPIRKHVDKITENLKRGQMNVTQLSAATDELEALAPVSSYARDFLKGVARWGRALAEARDIASALQEHAQNPGMVNMDGTIYLKPEINGQPDPRQDLKLRPCKTPLLMKGVTVIDNHKNAYVAAEDGSVRAFDKDGNKLWTLDSANTGKSIDKRLRPHVVSAPPMRPSTAEKSNLHVPAQTTGRSVTEKPRTEITQKNNGTSSDQTSDIADIKTMQRLVKAYFDLKEKNVSDDEDFFRRHVGQKISIEGTLETKVITKDESWKKSNPYTLIVKLRTQGHLVEIYTQEAALDTILLERAESFPKGRVIVYLTIIAPESGKDSPFQYDGYKAL